MLIQCYVISQYRSVLIFDSSYIQIFRNVIENDFAHMVQVLLCMFNVATLAKTAWQTCQTGCLSQNSNVNVSKQQYVSLRCIFVNIVMAAFSHVSTG